MPVDIQSKCCSGMAQIPLDCFDVISGTDCGHRVAVAEVVEAGIRTPNGGGNPFKVAVDRMCGQVIAQFIGKDQTGLCPGLPCQAPLLLLSGIVVLQDLHNGRCGGNAAGT